MTFSEWLKKTLPITSAFKSKQHQRSKKNVPESLFREKVESDHPIPLSADNFSTDVFPTVSAHQSEISTKFKYKKLLNLSIITEFFPPDYAATGQLIEELVKQLAQQGVNIEVFTGQPGYAYGTHKAPGVEQLERVRIQRSRTVQFWSGRVRGKALNGVIFTLRAVLHLIRHCHHHDVFLLTSAPPFLPIVGYVSHLLFRTPYVCLIYDIYPDIAIALGVISKNHWLSRFWQSVNQRVWRAAKGIVVLSPAMKQRVVATCPQVADKVAVIHSWGDPELILPIAKKNNWFAQKYSLVNKFTVLYSGNMGRCHDMDTILEAAKQLQGEPIQFVCIGNGSKRESLIEEVKRLGLNNFLFLPYQDKQVLPYSLTACDLSLVSVEAGMESLIAPSKLYPALATGRPVAVVCSKYSYLQQLITEAKCGKTFEKGDGYGLAEFIRLLNSDRQLAELMGQASRQYLLSNFTPKIIAKQYLRVLNQSIL